MGPARLVRRAMSSSSTPPPLREKTEVLDASALDRALTRGVTLAKRLAAKIAAIDGAVVPVGALDITLYRDDLDMRGAPVVRGTDITFSIKNKTVVLVDDVLFTGRTIRAA